MPADVQGIPAFVFEGGDAKRRADFLLEGREFFDGLIPNEKRMGSGFTATDHRQTEKKDHKPSKRLHGSSSLLIFSHFIIFFKKRNRGLPR